MGGTHADVRAFLTTGQYTARVHDNLVLVNQALAAGGPEVQAAAQAALAGPTSGLVPFLQTGLPKAQQRDAFTTAHKATIDSYLATIDGNVAQARKYAAEAAKSYATARGAANEAAGYANQAQASAVQAADWAAKAAESARQAQASADQAAAYAKQARTAAASADAAANRADLSVTAAAGYALQAKQYAADAKTASDEAYASKIAAGKSRDEAAKAAEEAKAEVAKKQQTDAAAGKLQGETAVVDDNGRVSYIEAVPRGELKQEVVKTNETRCGAGRTGTLVDLWTDDNFHKNAAGVSVCDVTYTVRVSGIVDYVLKTCPEAGLSIAACQGKYGTWDTLVINSQELKQAEFTTTVEMTEEVFSKINVTCTRGVCGSRTVNVFTLLVRLHQVLQGPGVQLVLRLGRFQLHPLRHPLQGRQERHRTALRDGDRCRHRRGQTGRPGHPRRLQQRDHREAHLHRRRRHLLPPHPQERRRHRCGAGRPAQQFRSRPLPGTAVGERGADRRGGPYGVLHQQQLPGRHPRPDGRRQRAADRGGPGR
ncbi:hypothetical protein ACFQ0T_35900 [Kitasatospora gansuensis]